MIKNNEFKHLKYYKEMIQASERSNIFDQYSIIKSFVRNNSKCKQDLLDQMSFNDEENLQRLFEELEGIEIDGDASFYLGNPKTNVWLKFLVIEDGTFVYLHARVPDTFNRKIM